MDSPYLGIFVAMFDAGAADVWSSEWDDSEDTRTRGIGTRDSGTSPPVGQMAL